MDELELVRSFRRGDVKPNPVARAAARDWLLAHIADAPRLKRNIFICYRHEDSSAYAGWLVDALGRQFGRERVFRDMATQRGVDFRSQVSEAIDSCAVLLAVIGPKWLTVQDESGRRQIDHPRDLVALEIAAALKRDIRVIPVLVAGARMPREVDLPEHLAGLAYRTAIELPDTCRDYQISSLAEELRRVLESGARRTPVVIGDASRAGRARVHNALRPDLQRAAASIQREARFALELGVALLRTQVRDRQLGVARDDWLSRSRRDR